MNCVTRAIEPDGEPDGRRHRRQHDVPKRHGPPPCARARIDLEGAEGVDLGEAPEPQPRILLLHRAHEVPVVAPPVAREEAHRRAQLVGSCQKIEGSPAPSRDESREELAAVEHAEDDRGAVGAHRVERFSHHRVRRERNSVEPTRPRFDRALHQHLADDGDDRERLVEKVVAAPRTGPEALHTFLERARVRREDPVGVVLLSQIGERDRPGISALDSPPARVEHLPDPAPVVHDDEATARLRDFTLPGSSGRPEVEKPLPVLRREAFEPDVGREHVGDIPPSRLAIQRGRATRPPSPMAAVTAESLFVAYFWPLYPDDARKDLARARSTDANPAQNPALFAHVEDAATVFERMAPRLFEADDPGLDRSDESVHRLSRALTRERRDAWSARGGPPGSAESELFNVVAHGVAYVGACVVNAHSGRWSLRRPLWESVVTLESRAGRGDLAILQWWLKSLTDASLTGEPGALTLADRYRTHVEIPRARPEELPLLAAPRVIPRLTKVRYDTLHKHLRAHLPEVKDLGEHFPSAERFHAYDFAALDFHLLGQGRMLLITGTNAEGVHLFWLGALGFEKGAFFPADAFPAPVVRTEGDKLFVLTQVQGRSARHEMLWWGP